MNGIEIKPIICECGNDEFNVKTYQHEKELEFGVFDVISFYCLKCDRIKYVEYLHDLMRCDSNRINVK